MPIFNQASAAHKRVWADLLIDVVVTIYYFWQVSMYAITTDALDVGALASVVFNSVLIALLLAVPLHAYIALRHKDEVEDERDLLFKARANQYAFYALLVLNAALMWSIVSNMLFPQLFAGMMLSPLAVAHFILLSIVIVHLVRAVVILQSYRRGY